MINLLPSQQKKELRLDLFNQSIISTGLAVILMVLILALLLFVAQAFLDINVDEAEKEAGFWRAKPEIRELENLEKKIKELNRNLVFLNKYQKEQLRFSLILEDLVKDMPSGIRLESLSIKESGSPTSKAGEVSIWGYSSTRDILLTLKNTLENNPCITNFNFPLSNLTKATDIDFYLSFKITDL